MPDPHVVETAFDVELYHRQLLSEMAGRRLAPFGELRRLLVVSSFGFDGWVAKKVRGFDESPVAVKLNEASGPDGEQGGSFVGSDRQRCSSCHVGSS